MQCMILDRILDQEKNATKDIIGSLVRFTMDLYIVSMLNFKKVITVQWSGKRTLLFSGNTQ